MNKAAVQTNSGRPLPFWPTNSATVFLTIALSLLAEIASAQSTRQATEFPHAAYGAIFGTGVYQVDDRTVTLIRIPFGYQIREPTQEQFGIRLRLPVVLSFSRFDFDDFVDVDRDDVTSIGFVPGLELQFKLRDDWMVRPYAQAGYDFDESSSQSTFTWAGGVVSAWDFGGAAPRFTLGSEILAAGYNPDKGDSGSLGYVGVGVDYRLPLPWRPGGHSTFLATYGAGYFYFDDLEFDQILQEPKSITREAEISLALGRDPPFSIWGWEFDRIGLSYRFGGPLDAILLVSSFPF